MVAVEECNNSTEYRDGCGADQSFIAVTLEANEVYYFVVDGVAKEELGEYRITVEEIEGDSIDNPIIIDSLPYSDERSTMVKSLMLCAACDPVIRKSSFPLVQRWGCL